MKRKRGRYKLLAIMAVFAVVAGLFLSNEEWRSGAGLEASYNVLSIDKIEYTTTDKMWVILLSQSGGGDILKATLRPDDGDKIPEKGELATTEGTVKYPVEVTMTPISEQCIYPIKSTANLDKIYKYQVAYYKSLWAAKVEELPLKMYACDMGNQWLTANNNQLFNTIKNDCMSKGASSEPKDYYLGWTVGTDSAGKDIIYPYCIYPTVFGRVGDTNTYLIFKTKLGVSVNGKEQSGILTNGNVGGSSVADIGNYGTAFWYGNLESGAYCPSFSDQNIDAAYLPGEYSLSNLGSSSGSSLEAGLLPMTWSTFDERVRTLIYLEQHKAHLERVLQYEPHPWVVYALTTMNYKCELIPSSSGNLLAMTSGINPTGLNYNSWVNSYIKAKKPFVYNGKKVAINEPVMGTTSLTAGVMTVNVDPGTFIYPQFKLEIDGNILPIEKWVVEPQYCKPKLELVSNNVDILGTEGTQIKLKATNEVGGSDECQMTASVVCKTGFSAPVPKPLGTFESGESKPFYLDISCSVEKSIADSCVITLQGSRGERVQQTLTATCKPETNCTPNTKFCEGNYMVECKSDGTKGKAVWCDVCKQTGDTAECIITTRETICDDGVDNDEDGAVDCSDLDCSDSPDCGGPVPWESWMFSSLVAGLVAMLAFSGIYSYRKNPKNKAVIAMISAGIVFGLVFLAVEAMGLEVGNPFEQFVPEGPSCSTEGLWLGQYDPGYIGCVIGEIGYYLEYLFAFGIGGLAAFLFGRTLSRTQDFADKPLIVWSMAIIAFVIVFIIAKALFVFAIILLVLFVIFKYVMSPLAMVGKMSGAIGGAVHSIGKKSDEI